MLDDQERQQRGHDKTYEERKHFIIFQMQPGGWQASARRNGTVMRDSIGGARPVKTDHCTGLALGNPNLSSVRVRAPFRVSKYEIPKL
jgi:hypothetical protein